MGAVYRCEQPRRLQALRAHPTLNGIDYLEVLDRDAVPLGSPRQRTLLVRVVKPLEDLESGNPTAYTRHGLIEGGVRVPNVRVAWAARAADAAALEAAGLINGDERAFLLSQPAPDRLLVVRTDREGDFDTYRLRLVAGATGAADDAPLDGFDPLLASVAFSFKVECPSEFDCAAGPACPPEPAEAPAIDYLAKDYASFRRLMLDRLAIVMPDWRERSAADLGIALVEVMAYVGDHLSYYQDAAATEAYLGTARRRPSVRRHARLLDYPMHDGSNARAWVALGVEAGVSNALLRRAYGLDGRTRFLTRVPGRGPAIAAEDFGRVLGEHAPLVFEPLYDVRLFAAHNRIPFHTWGDADCCLPKGATRATLRDDPAARLRLRPGDVLVFEEVVSPATGALADAAPAHRHAVRLTAVAPAAEVADDGTRTPGPAATDPLFDQPIVEIEWAEEDALPFPLCLSATIERDGVEVSLGEVSVARGNVVLADHGRTLDPEPLPPPTGSRRYRPVLREQPVTQRVPLDAEAWTRGTAAGSATAALVQDPRAALPAAALLDAENVDWEPSRDLLAAGPFEAEFVVETEEDGRALLRFGDDVYGMTPEAGVALAARYRVGTGPMGNVGTGAISHVVTEAGLGIVSVRNPLPGRGGTAPEPLEDVRRYAPQAFRRQERAVTEADYAAAAERHPAVAKAVARRRWTGSWHTVFITVDRTGGRPVDRAFEAELTAWLDRFKLAGHDVEIEPPRFVPLDIALTVCVDPLLHPQRPQARRLRRRVIGQLLRVGVPRRIEHRQQQLRQVGGHQPREVLPPHVRGQPHLRHRRCNRHPLVNTPYSYPTILSLSILREI